MFNFGWGELVVIGIVALIAIGPKELPTVLRTMGQWMGKVRRMANEFQGQFQEALREAEFADLKKHADEITGSVSELSNIDPLADVQKDVESAFDEKPALETAAPTETAASADVAAVAEPAAATENATPAALPEPAPLPQIEVPLPEPPAAVTHEDFAAAAPPPAKKKRKKAGGEA
jgi:sec-independent protein translocase protein TatB